MQFQSKTIIEITDRSIKFLQVATRGNNPLAFAQYASFDHLDDAFIVKFLSDIQKSKKLLSLKTSHIIFVIPRQHLILRYLDLPSEKPEELKAMVELQAAKELPFNREEVVVDFIPLDKHEGYTKVLVVAALAESVLHFIKLFESVRIKPTQIVPSFVGLWHWYRSSCSALEGVSVLLDIDSNQSEICLCDHKRLYVSRPTSFGVKEINSKEFDEFLKQLDWTIASYVKEQLGLSPAQIILMSSIEENALDLMTQIQIQYNTPVKLLLPVKDAPVQKSFVWPEGLLQEGASVSAALGFLYTKGDLSIDLTPPEIRAQGELQASKRQGTRLGIAVAIAIISVIFCISLHFIQQNRFLSNVEEQTRATQKKVAGVSHKMRQINYLKAAITNRVVLMDYIDEIYRLLPPGVVLTNLTLSQEHKLTFQGFTNKATDVNDMQRGFVTSSRFDKVNLDYVNKRVSLDGELNYFKITCHIKSKGSGNEEI